MTHAGARATAPFLAGIAVLVSIASGSCGRSDDLGSVPDRDLSMLNRMVELNAAHRGIEPFLRNRARYDELAETAEGMALLAASELMVNYPDREEFVRDPGPWHRWRAELEEAATAAAAAARAGDADGFHQAYSRMDGSCIACHKRYLEIH